MFVDPPPDNLNDKKNWAGPQQSKPAPAHPSSLRNTKCLLLLRTRARRAQGELEVLRHRLEALSREKETVTEGASAKVEELEKKVLEGELQRRKMHNLIQVGGC